MSIFSINPIQSGSQMVVGLSNEEVNSKLRGVVCRVCSPRGESSGVVLNNQGRVITVAHNIPLKSSSGEIEFTAEDVVLTCSGNPAPCFPKSSSQIIAKNAKALDLYSLESEVRVEETALLPILPEGFILREGMKVYFAGYTDEEELTFLSGKITSVFEEGGVAKFDFNKLVLPGISGGPVAIQEGGRLYLAGIVLARVMEDLSPGEQEMIKLVQKHIKASQDNEAVLKVLGRSASKIGRAVDIRSYHNLFNRQVTLQESSAFTLPTNKSPASGEIQEVKYTEIRYGKNGGKSNRGVALDASGVFGRGAIYEYSFSPNPHTASGNYNKKGSQVELYKKSAQEFLKEIKSRDKPPKSFCFDACKTAYEATLKKQPAPSVEENNNNSLQKTLYAEAARRYLELLRNNKALKSFDFNYSGKAYKVFLEIDGPEIKKKASKNGKKKANKNEQDPVALGAASAFMLHMEKGGDPMGTIPFKACGESRNVRLRLEV